MSWHQWPLVGAPRRAVLEKVVVAVTAAPTAAYRQDCRPVLHRVDPDTVFLLLDQRCVNFISI